MASVLVSGLINLETSLRVERFPLDYAPVRYPFHGVNSTISGVGVNVTQALKGLGDDVFFLSMVGNDLAGRLALEELKRAGLPVEHVLPALERTPQSVILYEENGQRQIHVDLKDIQEQTYPAQTAADLLAHSQMAVLCNINFSRPMLGLAQQAGVPIATDVHAIRDVEDAYNQDFMAAAQILFLSHENLPERPEAWVERLQNRYGAEIVVVGLGGDGALLAVRSGGFMERLPAATVRPIVNTIGAGDALFACFLHEFLGTGDPYRSLRRAVFFAGYKIGSAGAAEGLLSAGELDGLMRENA